MPDRLVSKVAGKFYRKYWKDRSREDQRKLVVQKN